MQSKQARGEDVDPEAQMSSFEMMAMMGEAAVVLERLDNTEREMKYFKMGAAKRIKCCYCEHKGHSILEEYTPFYAYIICFIAYLVLGLFSLVILPCILGIFRD